MPSPHTRASSLPTNITPILDMLDADATAESGYAFVDLVASYLAQAAARSGPVSTPHEPADLVTRFEEPLPTAARPLGDVLARIARDIIPDCNHLMDPRYMGHQVSAPLPATIWADALIAGLNQSTAVWEMSPVGTIIENRVIRWMADLAGFGPEAGGTLTSGGTEATFAALLAARHACRPDAWRTGIGQNPPVVVCGEHAHYGIARAVGELGLGTDHLVTIPSAGFAMDVERLASELAALRAAGRDVMAVVATAGSTATGSFDALTRIGPLCQHHGLWLHVDAAHGGSALLAPAHRDRLAGLEFARSMAWDPHKMMLLPLAASVVLVRHETDLDAAFSQRAPYLFHQRGQERPWDQGLRSFQCSRRADAFKVWFAFQRYGAVSLGALYDHLCGLATQLYHRLVARDDFHAEHAPESNILCFRYTGKAGLSVSDEDALNVRLRTAFNQSGAGWITTTVLRGRRVLRVTLMNPRTTPADLDTMLDGLATLGRLDS